jgi:hypothetical protein
VAKPSTCADQTIPLLVPSAETLGTVPGKAETVVPWLTGVSSSIIVFVAGSSFRA